MEFLNVLFLVGAGTAAVPILIHLIQRRRAQQVVFGSLRLLRRTSHRVVRRRRFEEFLLVVLRAAALAALAVAFARPFLYRPLEPHAGGQAALSEEAALLLIDNSYSMRAEGRLERAKAEALEFLRRADPLTKVGVAVFSSQFQELCPIGSELARAEEAVRGTEASWRGTNLSVALKQADRLLTRTGRNEARRRIVLVSDFQDSSWQDRGGWTLTPGVELTLRNVSNKPVPNVLIGRVAVPRLVVAGGFVEVISATVRNLTDRPLGDARVIFRVEGQEEGTLSVNVRPGEEAPVRFRHKFTQPGDVIGSIAVQGVPAAIHGGGGPLADDPGAPGPEDNVAHFCVHVTPRIHVLLVNADRGEKMVLNDGLFVRTALEPQVQDVISPFELREVAPAEMKPSDLDGMDVVLFLNVSGLPEAMTLVPPDRRGGPGAELQSPLGRFVARGGGIGLVCGSRIVPEEFNRTFAGLAPCRLSRRAMADGDPPVVLNQIDLRHEIFAEFARPHSGDLSLAEFSQYFLVTDSLGALVPARFSGRDAHPALLERSAGQAPPRPQGQAPDAPSADLQAKGKSILLVSSLDLEWNNLCLKSVFVPFAHQLAKRLCARRTGSVRNFTVGDEVTHAVPPDAGEATLRRLAGATGKAGNSAPPGKAADVQWEKLAQLKVQRSGRGGSVTFSPEQPGIYELTYKGGSARFAANLDAREPDFRPMDTRLLLTTVQKPDSSEGKRVAGPGAPGSLLAASAARERIESRQKLWRYLMIAVLVVLVIEMLLAARIGRA